MFWRRKNDGFEWQRYVRTTRLVRRKARRERLEQAQAVKVTSPEGSYVVLVNYGDQEVSCAGAKSEGRVTVKGGD